MRLSTVSPFCRRERRKVVRGFNLRHANRGLAHQLKLYPRRAGPFWDSRKKQVVSRCATTRSLRWTCPRTPFASHARTHAGIEHLLRDNRAPAFSVAKLSQNAMEAMESGCIRPRQVRYQAALRPDSEIFKFTADFCSSLVFVLRFPGENCRRTVPKPNSLSCPRTRVHRPACPSHSPAQE